MSIHKERPFKSFSSTISNTFLFQHCGRDFSIISAHDLVGFQIPFLVPPESVAMVEYLEATYCTVDSSIIQYQPNFTAIFELHLFQLVFISTSAMTELGLAQPQLVSSFFCYQVNENLRSLYKSCFIRESLKKISEFSNQLIFH